MFDISDWNIDDCGFGAKIFSKKLKNLSKKVW